MKAEEFTKQKGYDFHKDSIIYSLMEEYSKVILTDFVDYLLKEGYCDTDVYAEPPTAIDDFLSKR